jgi:hypothetical protein
MLAFLTALALFVATPDAHAAPLGNQLTKRAQLRYQDVVTTRDGTRWRGRILERGDVYRVRLDDNSEVAVPKEQVASVTRELHPGYPHTGQWEARAGLGFEIAFAASGENAGTQYGPMLEIGFGRNFGGPFEPEVLVALSPLGPEDGSITPQLALGARYYLQPLRRAKPYTSTQIVVIGTRGDLGLRTGPGIVFDITPNIGVGVSQGVTLMTQTDPEAAAVGYHGSLQVQGRF